MPVALDGRGLTVGEPAVEFDDDSLGAPQAVDLEALDVDVDLGIAMAWRSQRRRKARFDAFVGARELGKVGDEGFAECL